MSSPQTFIPPFQKKWCLDIYNKFLDMSITSFISQEMTKDGNPSSLNFEIIRNRLHENAYMSPAEWIRDVNSVLYTQKSRYEKDTPSYIIIVHLEKWFQKKVKGIPPKEIDLWMLKYHKVQKQLKRLMKLKVPSDSK